MSAPKFTGILQRADPPAYRACPGSERIPGLSDPGGIQATHKPDGALLCRLLSLQDRHPAIAADEERCAARWMPVAVAVDKIRCFNPRREGARHPDLPFSDGGSYAVTGTGADILGHDPRRRAGSSRNTMRGGAEGPGADRRPMTAVTRAWG